MKKFLTAMISVVLLVCMLGCAFASTWDYSFSSLKRLVMDSTSNNVIEYTTSSGVDHVVIDFSKGSSLSVWAEVFYDGNSNRIIKYILYTDVSLAIGSGERTKAFETINTWNLEKRYPKAVLYEDDTFLADGDLMGTADLTTDMVDEFIGNMLFGSKTFLSFLNESGFTQFHEY